MSPALWSEWDQGIPDKNDILDVMMHARRAGPNTTDSLWMFGGISIVIPPATAISILRCIRLIFLMTGFLNVGMDMDQMQAIQVGNLSCNSEGH